MKYKVRELATLSEDEIWRLDAKVNGVANPKITIIFEDGSEGDFHVRQTIVSWYIWQIQAQYPKSPILQRHHMGNTHIGSSTHLKLLSYAVFDTIEVYNYRHKLPEIDKLAKLAYVITNKLYNAFILRLEAYPTSISAKSFTDLIKYAPFAKVLADLRALPHPCSKDIDDVYFKLKNIINHDPDISDNLIVRSTRHGMVKMGQVLQCVGPRGSPTDIDSRIFPKPILTSFAEGMRTLEDQMKESRSAAKSLLFSEKPMQDSEYINRNIQLMAETFQNVHMTDCGSTDYIPFQVRPGDMKALLGIYYKTDKGIDYIRPTDNLVGKTILIRNQFTCKHPDRYGVCSTCFGELALSYPERTVIGHFSVTQLLAVIVQGILSTKHQDTSAGVADIILSEYDRVFIRTGETPNTLYLADEMVGKDLTIIVPADDVTSLRDIEYLDDVETLMTTRITEITYGVFTLKQGKRESQCGVRLEHGGRKSSFTHAALRYFKEAKWSMTETGDYVFNLKGWTNKEPLFELPMKHFNMVDFLKTVGYFIKGTASKDEGKYTIRPMVSYVDNVGAALMAFHEIVRTKIPDMNLSYLQATMLSTMITSRENNDFNLPPAGVIGEFNNYQSNMTNRSLAPMMAYQYHLQTFMSLRSYLIKDRPDHPMDDILVP